MSSLAESSDLVGFFSYSREDDKGSRGALSALRDAIQSELSAQLGRSPSNFRIWQDKAAIPVGTYWEEQIRLGISQSVFFVPIITPRVFKSDNCALEFKAFLARERELGRADLVFPILYIEVPELEDERVWRKDPVLNVVGTRQYFDWQQLRHRDPGTPEVGVEIERFCRNIARALRKPWVAPADHLQPRETAGRPQAAQSESERSAREQRQGEAARVAADEEQNEKSEQIAPQRFGEEGGGAPQARSWWPPSRPVIVSGMLSLAMIAALLLVIEYWPQRDRIAWMLALTAANGPTSASTLQPSLPKPSLPKPSLPRPPPAGPSVRPAEDTRAQLVQTAANAGAGGSEAGTLAPPPLPLGCGPGAPQRLADAGGPFVQAMLRPVGTVKEMRAIAISPDGKSLASAGDDGFIRIWDADTLKWVKQNHEHGGAVYSLAFSRDGNMLASASFDGTVRIWNARTLAAVQVLTAVNRVKQYAVEFEAVDKPQYVAAAGADGSVRIWDWRSGRLAADPRSASGGGGDPSVGSLSFAPDGSGAFVTANFDGTIKFFVPGRSEAIPAFFPNKALRVAYSPDDRLVAAAGVDDAANQTVRLWNASTHALVAAYEAHRHSTVSVAWSHDGRRLVTGGGFKDPTVRLWEAASGRLQKTFSGHAKDVEAVAFHPNGKWLVSASEDGTLKVWDIDAGKELLSVVGFADGQFLAYAPNGCYTGRADASNYVKFVTKDSKGHDRDISGDFQSIFFMPGDATDVLLSR